MTKILIKTLLTFIVIIIIIIFYLSSIGLKTEKFNNIINTQIIKKNPNISLKLKDIIFLLNPFNMSVNIKTYSPEILIDNNELKLEIIKTNISLKSFLKKDFLIDDLSLSTKTVGIKDLIFLARSYKNSAELLVLNQIIKGGFLIADVDLNFDKDGQIKDDYEIKGIVKNTKLNLLNRNKIENLNFIFKIKKDKYYLEDIKSNFKKVKIFLPSVEIQKKNNQFFVSGKLKTDEKDLDINILNDLLDNKFKNLNITNIAFSSKNDISFFIDEKFKINNFNLDSQINVKNINYKNDLPNVKKYLKSFKDSVELEDHQILLNYKKDKFNIKGKGKIKIENKIDTIEYKIQQRNNQYIVDAILNLSENDFSIPILNYKKKKNTDLSIKVDGIYETKKKLTLNKVSITENKNFFLIENLKFNEKIKILSIDYFEVNFVNENKIKNQLKIKRDDKNYKVNGVTFDIEKLIENINKNNDKSSTIFNNLNTNLKVNISKTFLDKKTFVKNLNGNINFKKNVVHKLNLDSAFPNEKKLNITIDINKDNERVTTLYSGHPKPLLNQYKFIKGFEDGVLDFYSVKKNDVSNSILKIDNFKIQEVPVLAKLLTLASLQGIADLLTGEGIRFTDFEMKFMNDKNLMKIEEMYAIGPAISILMDGYIQDNKLISLRGTLVPATTINKTISAIPIIGKILVGEKTGEGVFGVSFKIKGSPKNLKTSVNPVKTLTPRFITRTLEKIKKN